MNRFFPSYDTYKITSPFGMRTLGGVTKLHKGIDLVAKTTSGGSAVDYVTAHTGGTVTGSGYDGSAGNYIKLQTAPGVTMVYYHLASRAVKKGDKVGQGSVLGYMGATGNVTGAHLHFGIQADGEWIDPEPYLDRDFGKKTENPTKCDLPVLSRGSKGEAVRAMQALLILRGFSCGTHGTDGSFGPATAAALEKFQRARGLTVDKQCGEQCWRSLIGGGSGGK